MTVTCWGSGAGERGWGRKSTGHFAQDSSLTGGFGHLLPICDSRPPACGGRDTVPGVGQPLRLPRGGQWGQGRSKGRPGLLCEQSKNVPLTIVRPPARTARAEKATRPPPHRPRAGLTPTPGIPREVPEFPARGHRADDSPWMAPESFKLPRDEMRKNRRTRFRGDPLPGPHRQRPAGSASRWLTQERGSPFPLGPHLNPDCQRSRPNTAIGSLVVRGEGIRCQDALPLSHPVPDKVRTHLAGAPSRGPQAHPDGGPGSERPRHPLARSLARTRGPSRSPAARARSARPSAARSRRGARFGAHRAAPLRRAATRARTRSHRVLAVSPQTHRRVPGTLKGPVPAGAARQPPPAGVVGVGARFELGPDLSEPQPHL